MTALRALVAVVALAGCGGSEPPVLPADNTAAAGLCGPGYAACSSFVDGTGPPESRSVTFADFQYAPKCLQVRAGQQVTFQGDFTRHPLRQACGPAPVLQQANGAEASFTLSAPGVYGYFCLDHGSSTGEGMAGAIEVNP